MLSLCSFPGCKMGANYSSLCLTGSWRLTPYRGRKIPPPPTQLVKKPTEKKKKQTRNRGTVIQVESEQCGVSSDR